MQKRNVVFSGVILMVMALCQQAWADTTIGINFCDTWGTPHIAGETVDGFSNWTDSVPEGATGQENGTVTLLGSNDNVACTWSSSNTWAAGDENTSEQQLYRVYLDDGDNGPIITIDGIGNWLASEGVGAYVVRVYHNTDNGVGFVPVDIKSGDTLLQTIQETNHWTSDGGIRAFVDSDLLTADSIIVDPQNRTGNSSGDQRACVAGIKIIAVDEYVAVNPDPMVGDEVAIDKPLSWQQRPVVAGLGVTYNLYFGTDPNEISPTYYGLTPVKTTSSDPLDFLYNHSVDMENSTTYYWRVDAIDSGDAVHTGTEWSFVTQPASVRIETDPASQTVAAGTTQVQFTVEGINVETYQWYKDGQPLIDDAADTMYSGETTSVLTIYDVQLEDEAYYYCQIDNSLNAPEDSQPARLLTQRLVAWWKLDGNLIDSVNEVVAGVPAHNGVSFDPNYVTVGIDGGALDLFGDVDSLVEIEDSGEYFNFYPQGYTVSAWVNMPEKSAWGAYIAKQGVEPTRGFVLTHNDKGHATHTLRQEFEIISSNNTDDSSWHWVVGTYDPETNVGIVFVDGQALGQATGDGQLDTSPAPLIFGAEFPDGSVSYTGLMDDVHIWSYPIDPVTIASMYVDVYPDVQICVEYPEFDIAGPDGVGEEFRDCKVNIYDFVPMLDTWLECNIVPICLD